jgi:hypothetical protein
MSAYLSRAHKLALLVCVAILLCASAATAEPKTNGASQASAATNTDKQAKLESSLAKMLSGATLEGSFTVTDNGNIADKLRKEKYTLGEVKKLTGDLWQIPARIQYGDKDVTVPIVLPIKWAGDTPIVTVDSLPLPGFGAVSARVMFFEGHYAGYWKHGEHGGHLFGIIHSAAKTPANESKAQLSPGDRHGSDSPGVK